MAYISETPPNQPDYPWFFKCALNLGQEKPMLINSADMSHLSPFSHQSILADDRDPSLITSKLKCMIQTLQKISKTK